VFILLAILGSFLTDQTYHHYTRMQIYRCWTIWDRNCLVIILPVLSVLACAVSGYGAVGTIARTPNSADIFVKAVKPWITTSAATTFTTNFMCTGESFVSKTICLDLIMLTSALLIVLIAYKLYRSHKRLGALPGYAHMQSSAQAALSIVIESATIWMISATIFLGVYLSGSNGQYVFLDFVSPARLASFVSENSVASEFRDLH
jgi:hypothetical protein